MRTRCTVHCPQGFHAGGSACAVRAAAVCGSVIVPLLVYRALFQAHLWLLAERPKLQHWGAVCPYAAAADGAQPLPVRDCPCTVAGGWRHDVRPCVVPPTSANFVQAST